MLAIVFIFILIVLWDIKNILKDKNKVKTGIVFFFFIGISLIVSLLLSAGVALKSPTILIENIVQFFLGVKNEG